eukprot:scaffold7428_cov153-Amphora_coffeaeformis.AAC.1
MRTPRADDSPDRKKAQLERISCSEQVNSCSSSCPLFQFVLYPGRPRWRGPVRCEPVWREGRAKTLLAKSDPA